MFFDYPVKTIFENPRRGASRWDLRTGSKSVKDHVRFGTGKDMRKYKGSVSKGKSYKEIGEFWDTHDLGEFWGQNKKKSFGVDIESEVTY
jgi:hypothetical protein